LPVADGDLAKLTAEQTRQLSTHLSDLLKALNDDDLDHAEQSLGDVVALLGPERLQVVHATLSDFDIRAAHAATRQLCDSLDIVVEG
jgi:hypothetical protein